MSLNSHWFQNDEPSKLNNRKTSVLLLKRTFFFDRSTLTARHFGTSGTQLSGRPNGIDELSKVYGWVPGQLYPKPNKNSLKRKSLVYGLLIYQPISTADSAHNWLVNQKAID